MPVSPQAIISSFYPGAYCLHSILELQRYKKHSSIYIMGNGPSGFFIPDSLDAQNIKFDLSGTSAIVFQKRRVQFYWYEPHFLINTKGFSLSTPESCASYALSRILNHEWTLAASSEAAEVLIANPQFPPNQFGYDEIPAHKTIVVPPWHFINESTDVTITSGLRVWLKSIHRAKAVLNFRGSIIRQISTAFSLDYGSIYIGGLDPSQSSYWYTDKGLRSQHMRSSMQERCEQVCRSFGVALRGVAASAPDESSLAGPTNTYYTFERSIILVLFMLCRVYPRTHTTLLANDPMVKELCEELEVIRPNNLTLVDSLVNKSINVNH